MNHRFSLEARQDLLDAAQWYLAEGGAALAERFEEDLNRALHLLMWMPRLGRPRRHGVRTWPLKSFPYLLAYRVQDDVLSVIAVAHQSRAPGYWQGRQGRQGR